MHVDYDWSVKKLQDAPDDEQCAAGRPVTDLYEGQHVEVRLHGDERWYAGVVLDRPRKMWVELADYGRPMIADEANIAEWRAERREGRSES